MVRKPKPLNNYYVMKSRTLAVQHYCFITSIPTITICCCSINHHKPPTLCFHAGKPFWVCCSLVIHLHIGISTIC